MAVGAPGPVMQSLWPVARILIFQTEQGIYLFCRCTIPMIKGKTVGVRHKPVLAVYEGCDSWGHRFLGTQSHLIGGFVTGENPGRRLFCRIIRESESLPARVDLWSVHLQSQPLEFSVSGSVLSDYFGL